MPIAAGETLLTEGLRVDRLYVLEDGAFEVRRNGVVVAQVSEPGAFLGEMSALLDSAPTATVVALRSSSVRVIASASDAVRTRPDLTLAIARLLARRLGAVTAYLVDIKRQYAGSGTHLGLMDQVLGQLVVMNPNKVEPGSERSDVPDY
jgi:CRP-like cAMP-binding protein